jgi:hypothetical protein
MQPHFKHSHTGLVLQPSSGLFHAYVNVTNGQSAEGAIRGQLHRSGHDDYRSGDGDDD